MGRLGLRAIINIRAKRGRAKSVAERVRKIEGVREAAAVFGMADVCALADVADLGGLERVVGEVASVSGVVSSETFPEWVV